MSIGQCHLQDEFIAPAAAERRVYLLLGITVKIGLGSKNAAHLALGWS
ncbi:MULTISPECIES: hypothetical protein [unclassified Thermosynechococcus]|nr:MULTISPECIES: hypothetical protein [unclassified Thermosynechococcus]HIK22201.1 hypothetical protein [Thermosynechococcus sp. M3746_W2019_013]